MRLEFRRCLAVAGLLIATPLHGEEMTRLPEGYWPLERARPILERTATVRLAPDLAELSPEEREAVALLLEAGGILHTLYERSLHREAERAAASLAALHRELGAPEATRALIELYRLFKGPIAVTLDNQRLPFLPAAPEVPGRNVYPADVSRDDLDVHLAAHPEQRAALLHPRSIVRRARPDDLRADMATLERHPVLGVLHPLLRPALVNALGTPETAVFYAVPYSVAYADELVRAHDLIAHAGAAMETRDPDFAQYLRLRARDLLTDDYEGGDAAWVTGRFGRLNAQIGSYETYDDKLYGVKTFFSLSLLLRDADSSAALERAMGRLQALQDGLPYDGRKQVREHIPVGVYDVIADFGQARSVNTATILPNEADHARKYGRTILIRRNLLTDPGLFAERRAGLAAVAKQQADDLTMEGNFQRTLWHEIGHYLGPDVTRNGRQLDDALAEFSDLMEELKADLVSLHAARALRDAGYLDDAGVRAFYADGVRRVLQKVRPRADQPYQTMQLMQMNFLLEHGVLAHRTRGGLAVDYRGYHDAVTRMLAEVLSIQAEGDRDAAAAFVQRWSRWDEGLHGPLAAAVDAASRYRYSLVEYAALSPP